MKFSWAVSVSVFAVMACGPAPAGSHGEPLWYRRSKALGTVSGQGIDSIAIEAFGKQLDTLLFRATITSGGKMTFVREWYSGYELIDEDSVRADPVALAAYLRMRIDTEVAGAKVGPLDTNELMLMADSAKIAALHDPPHEVVYLSYGYESTIALIWDKKRRSFDVLWYSD